MTSTMVPSTAMVPSKMIKLTELLSIPEILEKGGYKTCNHNWNEEKFLEIMERYFKTGVEDENTKSFLHVFEGDGNVNVAFSGSRLELYCNSKTTRTETRASTILDDLKKMIDSVKNQKQKPRLKKDQDIQDLTQKLRAWSFWIDNVIVIKKGSVLITIDQQAKKYTIRSEKNHTAKEGALVFDEIYQKAIDEILDNFGQ